MIRGVFAVAAALTCLVVLALGSGATSSGGAIKKDQYRRPHAIPFPDEDPYTEAKAELGRTLFFDPILSGSGARSCASCHNPGLSWGDGLPRAIGEDQKPLPLRTPTLLNIAWIPVLGWDGKYRDLESVAFGPITSPTNMNRNADDLQKALGAIPGYRAAFAKAFADHAISRAHIEQALATFERTIVSGPAPFDRWIGGDDSAIGPSAKRGFDLFTGTARCSQCHTGWNFTEGAFYDIGEASADDIGRGRIFTNSPKLQHAFKVPSLRDVAHRAPYMHDGSVPTLEAVIDLYDRGGIDRPSRSELIAPLHLSDGDKADLVAFLKTLSAPPVPVVEPVLPR